MASIDESLVTWATPQHATCSRHRDYALSCEQFDALLDRSDGKCELCGVDANCSAWGVLHIDHEHQIGRWAVRGLLCDGCNTRLQYGRRLPPTPPLLRYLGNAWYRVELDRLGLSGDLPLEPGVGSSVRTLKRSRIRMPGEGGDRWAGRHGKVQCVFMSWERLWYENGPFALRVTAERNSFPKWEIPFYKSAFNVLRYCDRRAAARAAEHGAASPFR